MEEIWRVFKVFVGKSLKEKCYYKWRNLFFSLLPILLSIVLVSYKESNHNINDIDEATGVSHYDQDLENIEDFVITEDFHLCYTPMNDQINTAVARFADRYRIDQENIHGYSTYGDVSTTLRDFDYCHTIIFKGDISGLDIAFENEDSEETIDLMDAIKKNLKHKYTAISLNSNEFSLSVDPIPLPSTDPPKLAIFGLMIIVCTTMFLIFNVVFRLVNERSSTFKDQLKTATKFSFLNELSHFVINYIQLLLILIICFIITYKDGLWESVGIWRPLVLFLLFPLTMLSFTFFISLPFKKTHASLIGNTLICYIPFVIYFHVEEKSKRFLLIFPINAFYHAINRMTDFTIDSSLLEVAMIYRFLIGMSIIYFVFYYILSRNRVLLRKWNYIKKAYKPLKGSPFENLCTFDDGPNFEKVSGETSVMTIRKLLKTYGGKQVISDFSINIFDKTITVLLGGSGSGKSTILKILAGLLHRNSGDIYVDCEENEVNAFQATIGYCPQTILLLPYFNCLEHLKFFGRLRAVPENDVESIAKKMLTKIGLSNENTYKPQNLRKGQQKKLNIACCLIGKPKLLLLDEPTGELDTESQNEVHDLLKTERLEIPILLTTHRMDEADILADRVAVLGNDQSKKEKNDQVNQMVVYGSPMFLKEHYGSGYSITLKKKKNFNYGYVRQALDHHKIRYEEKPSSIENQLCLILSSESKENYAGLINILEAGDCGVEILKLSDSTLDEVYINSLTSGFHQVIYKDDDIDLSVVSGFNLWLKQFLAILYKKILYLKSNFWQHLILISIPIIVGIFITIEATKTLNVVQHSVFKKSMLINLENFDETEIEDFKASTKLYFNDFLKYENIYPKIVTISDISQLIDKELKKSYLKKESTIVGAYNIRKENETFDVKMFLSPKVKDLSEFLVFTAVNFISFYRYPDNSSKENITKIPEFNTNYLEESVYMTGPIFLMLFCLPFLYMALRDRTSGFNKLENIRGTVKWISYYFVDLLVFAVFALILVISCWPNSTFTFGDISSIYGLFLTYGIVYLPIMYVLSHVFDTIGSIVTFLGGMQLLSIVSFIFLVPNLEKMLEYESSISVFKLLPDFAIKYSIKTIIERKNINFINSTFSSYMQRAENETFYDTHLKKYEPVLGNTSYFIVMLTIGIGLFLILLALLDRYYSFEHFLKSFKKQRTNTHDHDVELNETIQTENNGISNTGSTIETRMGFAAYDLCKKYKNTINFWKKLRIRLRKLCSHSKIEFNPVVAVKNIYFKVNHGNCLGIIGENGAGKTTTMEIITGNLYKNDGKCYLYEKSGTSGRNQRVDLDVDRHHYREMIGYCPQEETLCEYMNGRQFLSYLLMSKGFSCEQIKELVNRSMKDIDVERFKDIYLKHCSFGTKKKWNVAAAMIGNPSVICLDEPTTGVDAISRRYIWNAIKKAKRQSNKAIILATINPEECEMLCSKILQLKQEVKKEKSMEEQRQNTTILTFRLKPGHDLEENLQDADFNKKFFETNENQYQVLGAFKFESRRKDFVYLKYSQNTKINWVQLFDDLHNFLRRPYNKPYFDNFSVGQPTLGSVLEMNNASTKEEISD